MVTLQNTDGGLIPYVQKGGKLPLLELIKDCQQKIDDFCHLENTEINRNVRHYGRETGETPCIMFFNLETRQIKLFNKTSGDLIIAEKFRQGHLELLKLKYSQEKVLTSTEESELNEYSSVLDNTLDW